MRATRVHQVGGDAFSIWEDGDVFAIRCNPLSVTSRVAGSLFGLAFLGFGVAVAVLASTVQNDPPHWLIYGTGATFALIGVFILRLSLSKSKKLRFVEVDTAEQVVRHGHYLEDVKETDGEIPIEDIQKLRLDVGHNDDFEIRASDGRIEHGHTSLHMTFDGGRLPRSGELLSGDYYFMKDLHDRIEMARRAA